MRPPPLPASLPLPLNPPPSPRADFAAAYPTLRYTVSSSSKDLLFDLLDQQCTVSMSEGLFFGALGQDVDVHDLCAYSWDVEAYNVRSTLTCSPNPIPDY